DAIARELQGSQYSPGCFPWGQECEVSWPNPSCKIIGIPPIARPFRGMGILRCSDPAVRIGRRAICSLGRHRSNEYTGDTLGSCRDRKLGNRTLGNVRSSVVAFKFGNLLTRSQQSEAPHLCQVPFDSLTLSHLGLQVDPALGCNRFDQAHCITSKERRNVSIRLGCVAWLSSHPLRGYRLIRAWWLVKGAATIRAGKIRAFFCRPHTDQLGINQHGGGGNLHHLPVARYPGANLVLRVMRHLANHNPSLSAFTLNFESLIHNVLHAAMVDNSLHFVKNFSRFVLKGLASHLYNSLGNLVKPASATATVVSVPDANLDTVNVGNNLATAIMLQVAALGDCGVTPNLIIAKHISSPVPCAIAQLQQRYSSTGRWRKHLATF